MNKTNIEWCDYTWNPVTGCHHGCKYCYARKFANRFYPKDVGFNPHLWPERLKEPNALKKPARIFVCSMADLFGDWVPREWIEKVFETVKACPWHNFYFLTKNPKRLAEFNPWLPNAWSGVTATDQKMMDEAMEGLRPVEGARKYISCEPLLGPVILPKKLRINWLIIGGLTGPESKTCQPKPEWIKNLIDQAGDGGVPLFLKNNLRWPNKIQEWPNE